MMSSDELPNVEGLSVDLVAPLLDLLEDGVVVHDEERRIHLVNSATEAITRRCRDEILGKDCHEAFPPDGLCGGACAFLDGPAPAAEARRELTVPFFAKGGEELELRVRSDPIQIAGEKRGVLAVLRDVSEVGALKWRLQRRGSFHGMIGTSSKVMQVFETIRAVGASEYSVLVSGESGTGKELAARAIHNESRRKHGPFVPVNCGALPDNILESELFGHVRGAFTGAIRDKKGRFELANGGTLFLDEVGELPFPMQVKLLRALQEKTFERVGGEVPIGTDIRIVAATNKDLRQMVADERFREDLYYRLCVVPIHLPPLRERREDIPLLIDKILETIRKEVGRDIRRVEPGAMKLLLLHPWPGNVRELINALQFASVHAATNMIRVENLPHEVRFGPSPPAVRHSPLQRGAASEQDFRLPSSIDPFEAVHEPAPTQPRQVPSPSRARTKLTDQAVERALAETGGNKVKAAKLLGVGRATLYRYLGKQK